MISKAEEIKLLEAVREAGKAILEIYNDPSQMNVEIKGDNSPLTAADTLSHVILSNHLQQHFPDIPVISEEGKLIDAKERQNWDKFWLVDPLDGTKEFIKQRDDFTVNVALIENHTPVWGAVYAPVHDWMYVGAFGAGAWKITHKGERTSLPVGDLLSRDKRVAVQSSSHSHPDEEKILKHWNIQKTINMGSSLKFCLVAEGSADLYYRKGPTWEWDTAAAHAVALGAGVEIFERDGSDLMPLRYNKKTLKNDDGFICLRKF